MINLSVNINKVATLRNARGENRPDVEAVALDIESFGANGITVHPRPDERHIKKSDVYSLRPNLRCEFNIEGYPSDDFVDLVIKVRPTQVTLVPDAPDAITSSAGWDVSANSDFLSSLVERFKDAGIRTSIFINADLDSVRAAAKTGAERVELYTKPYADAFTKDPKAAIAPFIEAATEAKKLGLGVNAGHDLNLDNLAFFASNIPFLREVSIGHALICDALYFGLEETVKRYKNALKV
ncbi:MAG: pyridoxine 5'-phosphate synthase [Muribaculaceae bacterium]|nr:pyridoxine 5'-phosphate synthase [Muribaculaceae bacterium]